MRNKLVFLFGVAALSTAIVAQADLAGRARRIHRDAFVFDGHVHVINRQFYHGGDITERQPDGQWDLPRAKEGGVDALFFTIFVTEHYYPAHYETKQTLRLMDLALQQIAAHPDKLALARNATELDSIVKSGRTGVVLDLEGSFDLDGDPAVLRMLYRLGLRCFQLSAHNWQSNYADSCCSLPQWNGLNEKGRALVREANQLGMLINVSHASDAAIAQTVELSTDPVVATHHGLRSLNNIPRNLPDELVKKIASKGGLIGFHMGNEFHNRRLFDWRTQNAGKPFWDTKDIGEDESKMSIAAIDKRVAPMFPMVGTNAPEEIKFTPDQWLEVVDRVIALTSEDHVMLGTDFDGGPTLPKGMRDVRDLPLLTEAMVRRGWSETRIKKFLGGNLLRVFRQVSEKRAAR